jgi:hypothetical protein
MSRVWIHLVAMAILAHVMALAQQTGTAFTDTLAFENGSIANNVYSNECLGFSFVIPSGWQLSTRVGSTDVKATHNSRVSLILLTIEQQQGGSFKNRMSLNAYDAAYSPTVQQFVSNAAHGAVSVDQKNRAMVKDGKMCNEQRLWPRFRKSYRLSPQYETKFKSGSQLESVASARLASDLVRLSH